MKIIPIELEITIRGEIFGNKRYSIGTTIIPPPTPKIVDKRPTNIPVIGRIKKIKKPPF